MKEHIKFGDLLESLLNILEINALRLSKAINVDRSLVTKWINGSRIPSIHSDHLLKISAYLKMNIKNSYQLSEVEAVCIKVIVTDKITDIENLILVSLSEARGYSKNAILGNRSLQVKRDVAVSLSSFDQILFGYARIYSECLSLFETAKSSELPAKTIYIKYDYNFTFFKSDTAHICQIKYKKWSDSLKALLNEGWEVNILINISEKANRTMELLRVVFDLVKNGKVQVQYLHESGEWAHLSGMVIVSGVGAMYTMPYVPESIETAFCMRTPHAVEVIKGQVLKLIKDYSKPLIKFYAQNDGTFYRKNVIYYEGAEGMRLLYRSGLSPLLIPEALFQRIVSREFDAAQDVHIAIQDYDERKKAFIKNALFCDYMDFCWNGAITQLVYENVIDIYTHLGVKRVKVSKEESVAILSCIVEVLQSLKHFNIYLLHETYNSDFIFKGYSCLIKYDKRALFETMTPFGSMRLSIDEPTVINAIRDYFVKTSKNIAPVFKSKDALILWINDFIQSSR